MTKMEPITTSQVLIRSTVADLRPAILAAAAVVDPRNITAILACLRITPVAGKLLIEGTDLDSWLTVECTVDAVPAKPFTIRAALLVSLLAGALPSDAVEISRDGDVLTVTVGPAVSRIRDILPADDFPPEPDFAGDQYSVPETVLAKLIDSVSFTISREETRYYLHGIYLHQIDGCLAGVATDGHRLALLKTHEAWTSGALILPREACEALRRRLTAGGNQPVKVTADPAGNKIRFAGDVWTLTAKTIDGTYPNYSRVIPARKPDAGYACLSRESLRRMPTMPRSSIWQGNAIRLDLAARTASFQIIGEGVETTLPIEARGDFTIGFNIIYVRALAQRFGTVKIEATNPGDAAHVLTEDPDLTVVLMPMRV